MNPSLLPVLAEFGELSIRHFDVFFGILVFGVSIRMLLQKRTIALEFRKMFTPILLFLLYIGLSLVWVWFYVPIFFGASLASYLRLIVTALFGFTLHLAFVNKHDVAAFRKALIAFGIAAIAIGVWEALSGVSLGVETAVGQGIRFSGRIAGLLGFNSLGLISGLLVLYAFVKRGDKMSNPTQWVILLILGLLGFS